MQWGTLIDQTRAVPVSDVLRMTVAYFVVGYLLLWRSYRPNPVTVAIQLVASFAILHYSDMLFIAHLTKQHFSDGLWPVGWAGSGLAGAGIAYAQGLRRRPNRDGDRP